MERRLIPMSRKEFRKIKVQPDDTIIYCGSAFIKKYNFDRVGGILIGHVDILSTDTLEQVTINPKDEYYQYFQRAVNDIENAILNYPNNKIYLVDNSKGEIAKKMFLLYEFQRSTYDKTMLGLALN